MHRIPLSVRKKAFSMWFDGGSYEEVRDETGVSMGKQSQDIELIKSVVPVLKELREVNKFIRENGLKMTQVMAGAKLIVELEKAQIESEKAAEAVKQLAQYDSEAPMILSDMS